MTTAKRQGGNHLSRGRPQILILFPPAFVWSYSSAWLDPWQGGIKSLKHKQRKRDKKGGIVKEGRITKEKGKCRMYENTERKIRKCRRLKNIGEEQRNRTADKEGFI